MCGRVNIEHLRESPAIKIAGAPVDEEGAGFIEICGTCARKTNFDYQPPAPAVGDATQAAWMGHLRRHLTRVHVRVADATVQELASRLAEVGAPESEEAREVFDQIRVLLLTPTFKRVKGPKGRTTTLTTLPHLKETLKKLPPRRGILIQIAAALRTWRLITHRDPTADRFRSDRVIETMLQIPSPEAYIKHLNSRGLPHLAAMFHPNTLARAKNEASLRGLFAGSNEYWDNSTAQLNIVRD